MKRISRSVFEFYSKANYPTEAEDILKEAFMKILPKIDSLKGSDKLKNWMYQIA